MDAPVPSSKVKLEVVFQNEPADFQPPFSTVSVIYSDSFVSDSAALFAYCEPIGKFELLGRDWSEKPFPPSIVAEFPFKAIINLAETNDRIALTAGKITIHLKRKHDYISMVGNIKSELTALTAVTAETKSRFDAEFAKHAELISKADTEIKNLNKFAIELKSEVDVDRKSNGSNFSEVKKKLEDHSSALATKNTEIEEIQKALKDLLKDAEKLRSDLSFAKSELGTSINDLTTKLGAVSTEISNIKATATSTAESIRKETKALRDALASLSSKHDALDGGFTQRVQVETKKVEAKVEEIKASQQAVVAASKQQGELISKMRKDIDILPAESIVRHGSVVVLQAVDSKLFLASSPMNFYQFMSEQNIQLAYGESEFSWRSLWRVHSTETKECGSFLMNADGQPCGFRLEHVRTGAFLTATSHTETNSTRPVLGCSASGTVFSQDFGPLSIGNDINLKFKDENGAFAFVNVEKIAHMHSEPFAQKPPVELTAVPSPSPSTTFLLRNILRLVDVPMPSPLPEGNYFIRESSQQQQCLCVSDRGELSLSQRPFVYDKDFTSDFNWSVWWLNRPGLYNLRSASPHDDHQCKKSLGVDASGNVVLTKPKESKQELTIIAKADTSFLIKQGKLFVSVKGKTLKTASSEEEATTFFFDRKN